MSGTYAMGELLTQDNQVISTFSCKFNKVQLKYIVTRQNTLDKLSKADICIHTDHQNLIHHDIVHANLHEQQTCIFFDAKFS